MQAVIFVGIQASGKSSFFMERFFNTHVRLNLDMLRTRHREDILLRACLEGKQPFVVDNTNPTIEERRRYIELAKASQFSVVGYHFQSRLSACIERNAGRAEASIVPERGVLGTYSRLVVPTFEEGFDELSYVCIRPEGGFEVKEWASEV